MDRCKRIERVAEDGTTIIERNNKRISGITAEDHFILGIPRKAGSKYTIRMMIVSPDERGLEKGTLTIGPILAPT